MMKGNPSIKVRLEPHILEQLRDRMEARQRGRGGGIAHYLRCLAYRDLGLPEPEPWAVHITPRKALVPPVPARVTRRTLEQSEVHSVESVGAPVAGAGKAMEPIAAQAVKLPTEALASQSEVHSTTPTSRTPRSRKKEPEPVEEGWCRLTGSRVLHYLYGRSLLCGRQDEALRKIEESIGKRAVRIDTVRLDTPKLQFVQNEKYGDRRCKDCDRAYHTLKGFKYPWD